MNGKTDFDRADKDDDFATPPDSKAAIRLWLRMLACTTLVESEIRKQFRQQFDFTLPRFDVLAQLDRRPGGMMLGELAKSLMVSAGNVTPIIERLIADGLVTRASSELDRRVQIVSLTVEGRRKFRRMAKKNGEITAGIFRNLNGSQIEVLTDMLGEARQAVLSANRAMRHEGTGQPSSKQ